MCFRAIPIVEHDINAWRRLKWFGEDGFCHSDSDRVQGAPETLLGQLKMIHTETSFELFIRVGNALEVRTGFNFQGASVRKKNAPTTARAKMMFFG